ncbi:MAG: MBL fold metallo-hydrolase [Planctomycetes bacterium]|nr:MBL fold metallo-hydrolase [Planctomycetota bacterium]
MCFWRCEDQLNSCVGQIDENGLRTTQTSYLAFGEALQSRVLFDGAMARFSAIEIDDPSGTFAAALAEATGDPSRFAAPLVKRIEALGGIKWLFLTHQDDVADHAKWAAHFSCKRVLHSDDVHGSTRDVELKPTGEAAFELEPGLSVIPTPGHTRGSCCLHFKGAAESFLFGGDHIAWSPRRGHLYGFRDACWHSWPEVVRSLEKLRAYEFNWVLPGHGRRFHGTKAQARAALEQGIAWARS